LQKLDLKPLLPLYLVIFTGFCGYSLMITLFVPMLMGPNGFLGPDATTGWRSLVLGVLLAIYPLGQFLGSPVLGALSDRYGRKPVLTISLLIAVAAYVLISLGIELRSLVLIAIACLIGGLAESNIAIAQSAISDVATPSNGLACSPGSIPFAASVTSPALYLAANSLSGSAGARRFGSPYLC